MSENRSTDPAHPQDVPATRVTGEPATRRFLWHPRTWIAAVVLVIGLGFAIPAVYLGGTLDPQGDLEDLPVALVVTPQTVQLGGQSPAGRVADEIARHVDPQKIALQRLPGDEADARMRDGSIVGIIRIPADFDAQLAALTGPGPGEPANATVHLDTTSRAGAMTTGLFTGNVTPVVEAVRTAFGRQLLASAGSAPNVAAATALATPFSISTAALDPLPSHTGLGTSVFYLAIVLIIVAFIGASAIHPLIDTAVGFLPQETGPRVRRNPYRHLSRMRTLIAKWLVMIGVAPATAGAVLLIAGPVLGMPMARPLDLWLFSTAALIAVGLGALTVFAVFGSFGPLVNTFLFVALAMTSSGGAIPLEATPAFFRTIAPVEPMRAIVDGLRSMLYLDSSPGSGLGHAWVYLGVLTAVSVIVGLTATRLFDRVPAFTRHPDDPVRTAVRPPEPATEETTKGAS
ncbi:YhgE/Pip domain-containing protein [Gordonia cholesterolivorans]|uniref:ABC-2 type transporter transmembrane domain-containing protein n=1 Tax=Gordonia cholesterolivorans TaxID=559625 RepID=A0ABN3HTE4_9ACTN